ncbi:MAG: serine/threonine-protein kinase PknK [Polyangiaceae bacterium]|nr:serine/threonine-protein kinase PknK [Polyangiaceae bacterium]
MTLAQAPEGGVGSSSPGVAATALLPPGELLAQRYLVEQHLSHGGMGVVFRGRDVELDAPVAIKALRADRHHEQLLARFRHEYYLMATLSHPRFVEVRDLVLTRAGQPCLVMEYLPGADLDSCLPLSLLEGVEVLDQLCEALAFLHSRRYVHHDLKSSNVRIDRDVNGKIHARLIDFGIMESVGSVRRELAGTPAYLPPEVLYGAPTDPRLDLYSLGVLAFQVFAGYIPFDIRDAESFVQAKQVSVPDVKRLLHELPEPLAELIDDLMSPDPAARPHDAQVVRRRLRVFSPHLGAATALAAPPYLTPSRLFGRDAELESLLRAWEESTASPRLCGVRAPGGLGKSALLRELALQVRLRGGVAELFSVDPGAGAFSALRPLLRSLWRADGGDVPELRALAPQVMRVLPELDSLGDDLRPAAPHPDPAEDRRQLYRAVCEWVGRLKGERPLAVLVDDAHLADGASLEALRALPAADRRRDRGAGRAERGAPRPSRAAVRAPRLHAGHAGWLPPRHHR